MADTKVLLCKRACSLRLPPGGAVAISNKGVKDAGKYALVKGRNEGVPAEVVAHAQQDPATAGWFGLFIEIEKIAPPPKVEPALAGIPGVGSVLASGVVQRKSAGGKPENKADHDAREKAAAKAREDAELADLEKKIAVLEKTEKKTSDKPKG